MDNIRMHLTILPFKLVVTKLNRSQLEFAALPLLKLILFPNGRGGDVFFSMTETEDEELSFVMQERDLHSFSQSVKFEKSPYFWRAIQVVEGGLGFSSTGCVHALSEPLAKAAISIFYLATEQSDFVLVPEIKIAQALECLKKSFDIVTEGLDDIFHSLPQQSTSSNFIESKFHSLTSPPLEIKLCSLDKDSLPSLGSWLIKLVFFPSTKPRFFSYTITEDEISLILDRSLLETFPGKSSLQVSAETWKLIRVADGPLDFEEYGIVYSISEPITKAKLSLLYISTFSTDYLLVQQSSFHDAVRVLKKANFTFKE
jgi:hypothetical protein